MSAEPINILLVEDNPGDLFLIRRALAKDGLLAELIVAEDGQTAIQFVEQAEAAAGAPHPNLILLDFNLPRATGRLVLQRIKASSLSAVPVIVMTSSDSPLDREAAAQLGADYYFPKPTDLTRYMELGTIARKLLERRRFGQTA